MNEKYVAIIIPVHNSWEHTKRTIEILLKQNYKNYLIIIINDGSNDETSLLLKDILTPPHHIIEGDGSWFWTKSVNEGIKYASKLNIDYYLLLNNDVFLDKNYLTTIINNAKHLGNNIFSPTIKYLDTRGQYYGGKINIITGIKRIHPNEIGKYRISDNVLSVYELTGMSLLISKIVIEKIGLFDEINFPQYLADSEFTLRAKINGIKNYVLLNCTIGAYMLHSGHRQKRINFKTIKYQFLDIKSSQSIKTNYHLYKNYIKYPIIVVILRTFKNFFLLFLRLILGNKTSRKIKSLVIR